MTRWLLLVCLLFPLSHVRAETVDVLIQGGMIYDGTGSAPVRGDVAIRGDKIVAVGKLDDVKAKKVVNAKGLAIAPGFINMLSWSTESLLIDGRSQSEIRQGVTTQVMGEGWSMGPLTPGMKKDLKERQRDYRYDIEWTTLSEYLRWLERIGVSQNVASFLGATTVRIHVMGHEDRKPTEKEVEQMRQLVEREMKDGALGIASALIYPPAFYAETEELIEMCKVASKHKGKYISHVRGEGKALLQAIDELIRISKEAKIPAEIYHFKASGKPNWPKIDQAIAKVKAARKQGLKITADMYPYPAGSTGLDACIPPWAHEGGRGALNRRLQNPETRKKIIDEIRGGPKKWENLYHGAGTADGILLVGFKSKRLKEYQGKTLAEVAKLRKRDPVETLLDLVVEDNSRIQSIYFSQSEDVVRKVMQLPWVSFGSDGSSIANEGVFLKSYTHPRAYGCFARVLGKYVREEKLITLQDAIRRMTHLPASNLGLDRRGLLKDGYFADVVVFDPKTIIDKATFKKPHQYAVGMKHVFINGTQVLKDSEHTNAKPGRALWGPGRASK